MAQDSCFAPPGNSTGVFCGPKARAWIVDDAFLQFSRPSLQQEPSLQTDVEA